MEENHVFNLQKEPWTYGNGSLNPDLHPSPSNSGLGGRRGSAASRQRQTYQYPGEGEEMEETRAFPPYHPDNEPRPPYEHFSRPPYADEDEDEYYEDRPQHRQFIRRGSEGYEVRPINREEMIRQYVDPQPHLAVSARAQERADQGEESDNYGVDDEEDEGGDRPGDDEEMEREVRERMGEPGRYRPYVPERWESEDEDGDGDDEAGHMPNGLPSHD